MEEKWKINGDTPADLGVEAMVLYFQNLDDDYAELRVPLRVDTGVGPNWDEAH